MSMATMSDMASMTTMARPPKRRLLLFLLLGCSLFALCASQCNHEFHEFHSSLHDHDHDHSEHHDHHHDHHDHSHHSNQQMSSWDGHEDDRKLDDGPDPKVLRSVEEIAEERELEEERRARHGGNTYDDEDDDEYETFLKIREAWYLALGSSLLVSFASLICLSILPFISRNGKPPSKFVVDVLSAFGVGAMLGDTFFHQLPHAFGKSHSVHNHEEHSHHGHHHHHHHDQSGASSSSHAHSLGEVSVGISVLFGILVFFLVEKIVLKIQHMSKHNSVSPFHSHFHSHSHSHSHRKKNDKEEEEEEEEDKKEITGIKNEDEENEKENIVNKEKNPSIQAKSKKKEGNDFEKEDKTSTEIEDDYEKHEDELENEKVEGNLNKSKPDTDTNESKKIKGTVTEEISLKDTVSESPNDINKKDDNYKLNEVDSNNNGVENSSIENEVEKVNGIRNRKKNSKTSNEPYPLQNGHSEESVEEVLIENQPPSPLLFLGYLNLFSDGIHNFTDGLSLGSSFYHYGKAKGFSRMLFMLAHEIPQEVGDFGILVRSGMTSFKALLLNFFSALMSVLGTVIALTFGASAGNSSLIEGFTAGGFIYICLAGVVPSLNAENDSLQAIALQFASILIGMSVSLIISLNE